MSYSKQAAVNIIQLRKQNFETWQKENIKTNPNMKKTTKRNQENYLGSLKVKTQQLYRNQVIKFGSEKTVFTNQRNKQKQGTNHNKHEEKGQRNKKLKNT